MNNTHQSWDTAIILSKINQYYLTGTMQDGILFIKNDGKTLYFVRRSYERAKEDVITSYSIHYTKLYEGDNAWSESFFANFKKEIIHWRWFPTREQAREAVFAYIEGFYNTRRVQKRLA